jgi:hypothetical protein
MWQRAARLAICTLHGLTAKLDEQTRASSEGQTGHSQGVRWTKRILPRIYHDDGCPAAVGITEWQPHPVD